MRNRNWGEYNKKLIERGSITFLIDPKSLKSIQNFHPKSTIGRPIQYPDLLIEILLSIKIQFRLTYRSLEGFARSIFEKVKRWFRVPPYSNICKRTKCLLKHLPELSSKKAKVILVDASGIKVYGEGEWKRKIHGPGRPRKWLKMHIALDEETQEVIASALTPASVGDSTMLPVLLEQIQEDINIVKADGSYDSQDCRKALKKRQARALIPPPKNAVIKNKDPIRDITAQQIKGLGGDVMARSLWGKLSGYSSRSLVETAFSRYKRLFGPRLFSQVPENQIVENHLKWCILNKMIRTA